MKQFYKNTPVVLDLITRHVRRDADPSGFTIRLSETAGGGAVIMGDLTLTDDNCHFQSMASLVSVMLT